MGISVIWNVPQLIGAQWRHSATKIWVNIGSGNGLLPGGIKPLPEPMLTNITQRAISRPLAKLLFYIMSLKSILQIIATSPNELTHLPLVPHICISELGQH